MVLQSSRELNQSVRCSNKASLLLTLLSNLYKVHLLCKFRSLPLKELLKLV
jgi:hypothetical protein